jgi:ABC-type Zn uptake system ZnuABC Zn-binding protein ZnuA
MLDPLAAEAVTQNVAAAFCAVDQAHCPGYQERLQRFRAAIDAKMPVWQAALAPYRGAKVVTYHKDFDYFSERFGLEVTDTLEPKPGIPPSPTHLTQLIPKMRAEQVRLTLIEPYRERSNPDFVAEKTGARVLTLPVMPPAGDDSDYVALIDANVQAIAAAFEAGTS